MDDFTPSLLSETKNEWSAYLVNMLTPLLIEGIQSIFDESIRVCKEQREESKYLVTFQKFLKCVPHWNATIINKECERIIKQSKCDYIEDLITCVHIAQLKILTAVRVSPNQKKIDIEIPKKNEFIHQIYVNLAREVYTKAFIFTLNVSPTEQQRNRALLERIVQMSILNTIRKLTLSLTLTMCGNGWDLQIKLTQNIH